MSIIFQSDLFNTPGVKSFLSDVLDDLLQQISVLVIVPRGIDVKFAWSQLKNEFFRKSINFVEININNAYDSQLPISVISQALRSSSYLDHDINNMSELFVHGNLPEIILLDGLDNLSSQTLVSWMELFVRWGQENHMLANQGLHRSALVSFIQKPGPLFALPSTDIFLSNHWWWGYPSILETRLLCRKVSVEESRSARAFWREHLLPSLSLGDINLADDLWETVFLNFDDINSTLHTYGINLGWSKPLLEKWEIEEFHQNSNNHYWEVNQASHSIQTLWIEGVICYTVEYGYELHSAALAVIEDIESVSHRIWRAQVELLLPMIDEIRLHICKRLTNSFGKEWPIRWLQPKYLEDLKEVENNPLAVQLGYLEFLLNNCDHFKKFNSWRSIVSQSRIIRNQLAHYRPITYHQFDRIFKTLNIEV